MRRIKRLDTKAARRVRICRYHGAMTEDEHIQRHLEICQRVYERLLAEGTWPWPDSTESEDVIESHRQDNDL